MSANLPYLASPGTIKTALDRIKIAATPDRVRSDFVQTKLQIKGGAGAAIPPLLKKVGLVNSDGTPTELYSKFRNSQSSGEAIAQAMRIGYRELFDVNEYCYELSDKELSSLICQVTGAASDSSTVKLTASTFKHLRAYADFDAGDISVPENLGGIPVRIPAASEGPNENNKLGLNLSYTINLNLPATSDQAVFNAIFRSLKEHLLDG